MSFALTFDHSSPIGPIQLVSSKSISNRLLILQALNPAIQINNLSEANDTSNLQTCIHQLRSKNSFQIKEGGTSFRFFLALVASLEGTREIYIDTPLINRPHDPLTKALRELGAIIEIEDLNGQQCYRVTGFNCKPSKQYITFEDIVSSQYVSALMLVAHHFEQGLSIQLPSNIPSVSYLEMTSAVLSKAGIRVELSENLCFISPHVLQTNNYVVESDWSAAVWFYCWCAMQNPGYTIVFNGKLEPVLQGDAIIEELMFHWGVRCTRNADTVVLEKINNKFPDSLRLDISNCPDLFPCLAILCTLTQVSLEVSSFEHLQYKESNRQEVILDLCSKIGATHEIISGILHIIPNRTMKPKTLYVNTFDDHRISMAAALMGREMTVYLDDPAVVKKSFPKFWSELEKLGLKLLPKTN